MSEGFQDFGGWELGCEVAKNLVLAGAKALKIMNEKRLDLKQLGEEDSNFLAP